MPHCNVPVMSIEIQGISGFQLISLVLVIIQGVRGIYREEEGQDGKDWSRDMA